MPSLRKLKPSQVTGSLSDLPVPWRQGIVIAPYTKKMLDLIFKASCGCITDTWVSGCQYALRPKMRKSGIVAENPLYCGYYVFNDTRWNLTGQRAISIGSRAKVHTVPLWSGLDICTCKLAALEVAEQLRVWWFPSTANLREGVGAPAPHLDGRSWIDTYSSDQIHSCLEQMLTHSLDVP